MLRDGKGVILDFGKFVLEVYSVKVMMLAENLVKRCAIGRHDLRW